MQIRDLYAQYQIMPQLSLHMRRVAAVGQLILAGWRSKIDLDLVMRTLLLHDMGNIIKFDLVNRDAKIFGEIDDVERWIRVQKEYFAKYGRNVHEATIKIIAEFGNEDVRKVLSDEHDVYEHDPKQILSRSPYEQLLLYCDARVTPQGVCPISVRIDDLVKRYGSYDQRDAKWFAFFYDLESQIQAQTSTDLGAITEKLVEPLLDKLLTYTI